MKIWPSCYLIPFFLASFLFLLQAISYQLTANVYAADLPAVELVNAYDVAPGEKIDGDILSSSSSGLVRSSLSYDSALFGVVSENTLAIFRNADRQDTPVARNGIAAVNVTSLGGPISAGDYITSSEIAGKGQKAAGSGYVLGVALTAFDGKSGVDVSHQGTTFKQGQVQVAIRIEYAEISGPRTFKRLFDYLGAGLFSNVRNPSQFSQLVRYIAAALIILICLLLALFTFSRSIPKAIEAIGRNPLAKRSIYLSMIAAAAIIIIIIGIGIVAAVIILRV